MPTLTDLSATLNDWLTSEFPFVELLLKSIKSDTVRISILLLILLALGLWYSRDWWQKTSPMREWWERLTQKKLPKARPGKFSVAITHIEGDDQALIENQLLDSLRSIQGIEVLRVDRYLRVLKAPHPNLAEAEAQEKAHRLLKNSQAHLLIWGHVLAEKSSTVRLFLTPRDAESEQQTTRLSGETQILEFPTQAKKPFAAAVLAQVLGQLSQYEESRYVADLLGVAITELKTLIAGWETGETRAAMHNALGCALCVQGNQTGTDAPLKEAVAAYNAALEERHRDRVPLGWAMTQNNLGNALATLGERESGTKRLEEAVTAYRAALEEYHRDRVPLDWAMTQNNLGNALATLGERESGTKRLEEAVTAYRAALEEYHRDRVPLDWAMTQNNLGNALATLGERESGTKRLEEAVTAYREALDVFKKHAATHYVQIAKDNLKWVQDLLETKRLAASPPASNSYRSP